MSEQVAPLLQGSLSHSLISVGVIGQFIMSQRFIKYLFVFMQLYLLIYEDGCINFNLTCYLLDRSGDNYITQREKSFFLMRDKVLFITLHCEEEMTFRRRKKRLMM